MKRCYRTAHNKLQDAELYSGFRKENWDKLDKKGRLSLLQELENREAARQGRPAFKIVIDKGTEPGSMGLFNGRVIKVDFRFFEDNLEPDLKLLYNVVGAMDTVIHEGRHAYQRLVAFRSIEAPEISEEEKRRWFVNEVAYRTPNLAPVAGYVFQPVERDAREYAAQEIKRIYRTMVKENGPDDGFEIGLFVARLEKSGEFNEAKENLTPEMVEKFEKNMAREFREKIKSNLFLSFIAVNWGIDTGADNFDLFTDVMERLDQPDAEIDFLDGLDDLQLDDFSDLEDKADKLDEKPELTLDQIIARINAERPDKPQADGAPWRENRNRIL